MVPEVSALINECLKQGNVHFKKHALIRIVERKISIQDVEEALLNCDVIESYFDDKPLPSYLVIGYGKNRRSLHIVVALDNVERHIWIITVYEPDETKWSDQMTKRKTL
jgi:predicted ThiF/HesA family dinucleotide-utilizing enzyme